MQIEAFIQLLYLLSSSFCTYRHVELVLTSREEVAQIFCRFVTRLWVKPRVVDEKDKKGYKVTVGIKRTCKIYIFFSLNWVDDEKDKKRSVRGSIFTIHRHAELVSAFGGKVARMMCHYHDETPNQVRGDKKC